MTGQTAFRAALLAPDADVPAGLGNGFGGPAGRRFDVYRNNVAASLTEALQKGFPVLRKLVGRETFDRLAGTFLRAHPPSSPLLMHYGGEMPGFLEGFAPLSHFGYLPDVARLELAMRRSYHAADADPIAPEAVAHRSGADLLRARVKFAPAVELLLSRWPLYDIWRYNTHKDAPKPQARAQSVLILRPQYDPAPHAVDAATAACLAALLAGQDLATAFEAAVARDPDFTPEPMLRLLLDGAAISALD
jgi:hypothetical protein